MPTETFRVVFKDLAVRDLPKKKYLKLWFKILTHCCRPKIFFTFDFDNYKQFKTKVKKGKELKWKSFELMFIYETKYINQLHAKKFRINCYHSPSFGKDILIGISWYFKADNVGSASIDLDTLAAGPAHHDLLLVSEVSSIEFFSLHCRKLKVTLVLSSILKWSTSQRCPLNSKNCTLKNL